MTSLPLSRRTGMYDQMSGTGTHEVIIETPDHFGHIADMRAVMFKTAGMLGRLRGETVKTQAVADTLNRTTKNLSQQSRQLQTEQAARKQQFKTKMEKLQDTRAKYQAAMKELDDLKNSAQSMMRSTIHREEVLRGIEDYLNLFRRGYMPLMREKGSIGTLSQGRASMVTRNTSLFPVDMFRVVDVADTPLLSGASTYATISYMLSQSMNTELRIYPPGTVIPTSGVWPPTVAATPVKTFSGVRPGRYRIAESWDGMMSDNRKEKVTATILQNVLVLGVGSNLGRGIHDQLYRPSVSVRFIPSYPERFESH